MSNFGTVMPAPYQTVFDSNGDPVSGGLVWSYVAGTSTPLPTYTDVTLTVANPNPIVTDSAGRFTAWLPPATSYKFIFEGPATPPAHGAVIRTIDNVTPVPSLSGYVDLPATAGELLAPLTVAYLSDGSGGKVAGRWYLADYANAYSSTVPVVGIVVNQIAAGAAGYVRVVGSVTGPVVVVGTSYYIGHAGAIQATVPASNVRRVAVADTPNSLLLTGGPSLDGLLAGYTTYPFPIPISVAGSITASGDIYEKGRTTPLGHWIDVPFNAANFTGVGGGTWTVTGGQVLTNRYTLIGKTMIWLLYLAPAGTVAGAVTQLQVRIPGGLLAPVAAGGATRVAQMYDAAGMVEAVAFAPTAVNYINVQKNNNTPWALGALPVLMVTMTLEIQ